MQGIPQPPSPTTAFSCFSMNRQRLPNTARTYSFDVFTASRLSPLQNCPRTPDAVSAGHECVPNLSRPEEEKSSWHQFHKPGKERAQSTRQSANAWAKTAHGASGKVHTKNKRLADSECGSPDAFRLNLWEWLSMLQWTVTRNRVQFQHKPPIAFGSTFPKSSLRRKDVHRKCVLTCRLLLIHLLMPQRSHHSHFTAGGRSVNLHLLPQDPSHASNCLPFLLLWLSPLICHADNVVLAPDDVAELPPTIAFSGATSTSSGHLGSVCVLGGGSCTGYLVLAGLAPARLSLACASAAS